MKVFTKVLALFLCAVFAFSMAIPVFADSGDKVIHEVHLTMTEPTANNEPPRDLASAEPDKYTVELRYWLNTFKPDDEVTVLEPGETYGIVFYVHAVNGYKFEAVGKINGHDFNNSPTLVYINGEEAYCVGVETESKLYRANSYELTEAVPEKPEGFFAKIWKGIKNFFSKIVNFFKGLFGIK